MPAPIIMIQNEPDMRELRGRLFGGVSHGTLTGQASDA